MTFFLSLVRFTPLSPISQWKKTKRRLFWMKTIQNTVKHRVIGTGRLETPNRYVPTGDPSLRRRGHFRPWKVNSRFSAISFHIYKLERWKHHGCAQADDTDRLICNMAFSDKVMILTLGQTFSMTFFIVHSTRLDKTNTMLAKINAVSSSNQVLPENVFRKNGYFSNFCSPWRLSCWSWVKFGNTLSEERSKSYRMWCSAVL